MRVRELAWRVKSDAERICVSRLNRAVNELLIDKDTRALGVMAANMDVRLDEKFPAPAGVVVRRGIHIDFNPNMMASLPEGTTIGIIMHELGHVLQGYWKRAEDIKKKKGAFHPSIGNTAADAAINQHIKRECLPEEGVFREELEKELGVEFPEGGSLETFYDILEQHSPKITIKVCGGGGGGGDEEGDQEGGGGDGGDEDGEAGRDGVARVGGCGAIDDHGGMIGVSEEDIRDADDDIKGLIHKVKEASTGSEAAGIVRALEGVLADNADKFDPMKWIRKWLIHFGRMKEDFTWARINRRTGEVGYYQEKGIGKCVLAIDTSGSMDEETLRRVAVVVSKCAKLIKDEVWAVECDAEVQAAYQLDLQRIEELRGGGGTNFMPVFEWAERAGGVKFLMYFTDGENFDKDALASYKPPFPVLWVLCGAYSADQPFGKMVIMESNREAEPGEKYA